MVNIGSAALFYILALRYGHSMRILFSEGYLGTDIIPHFSFFSVIADLLIPYIVFSMLAVLILIPFILYKGIIFTILGYTLFYWFLFFPCHLIFGVIHTRPWAGAFQPAIILLAITMIVILVSSLFYFPARMKTVFLTFTTPKIRENIRIVHLSDIHAERYGPRETQLITIVNSVTPDIIIITGDLFIVPSKNDSHRFKAAVKIIERLKAKYGVYIVEGHHDINRTHHITELCTRKIEVLRNEWFHFSAHGMNLSLFGALLNSRKSPSVKKGNANNFRIYCAHDPALVKNLTSSDFDLALFGHTHASQVYIPLVSYLIVGKYRHGLYTYNNTPFYVNAGIGLEGYLAPRIRWFTFPEVVVIDLIPNHINIAKISEGI